MYLDGTTINTNSVKSTSKTKKPKKPKKKAGVKKPKKKSDLGVTDLGVTDLDVTDLGVTDLGVTDLDVTDLGVTDLGVTDLDVTDLGVTDVTDLGVTDVTDLDVTDLGVTDVTDLGVTDLGVTDVTDLGVTDVTDLDVTDLGVTDLDATDLDATDLDATDATDLDATDATDLDATDATDLDATDARCNPKEYNPFNDDILYRFICKYPAPLFNKIAGMVYGAATAECFGVQADNMHLEYLQERFPEGVKEMPTTQSHGIKPDDWGGNTDQLVLMIDTLIDNKCNFDVGTFAHKLKTWRSKGFRELGDLTGTGMDQLVNRVTANSEFTTDPIGISRKVFHELGGSAVTNGSIVRGSVLGVTSNWQSMTIQQAMSTHANSLCVYSSWIMTSMCRELMSGHLPPPTEFLKNKIAFIKKNYAKVFNEYQLIYECKFPVHSVDGQDLTYEMIMSEQLKRLKLGEDPLNHTLKTIGCGFYALNVVRCVANQRGTSLTYDNMFKNTVQAVVNQGGDTDTNAATVGSILGSWLSYTNLPRDWVMRLEHKRWLDKKLVELFKVMMK
jgi:ADP-ribosylglycohydrolase